MQKIESPIDLKVMHVAQEWARDVMLKRPYRNELFKLFASELLAYQSSSVLELGSGPGFLVKEVLTHLSNIEYSAFDFSSAMHVLARERLGVFAGRVNFITGSFTEVGWEKNLGNFDAVISIQAVHEVRHKNNTLTLFSAVKKLLTTNGVFLYCDHVCDENGLGDNNLYLNEAEQFVVLKQAGFNNVEKISRLGSLAMWRAFS